ncbi:hypothetical protein [Clostridium tarantellae]|uniref:Uncharacterized protein n=1 Tax=Clostridium tarantellae TaxID=39493 RepID=A0A6I1MP25_9CLOT|nr:hypothetical protein [Clostridium tarantellae]MPQ44228.1 hypothetical protein [Clostridium tarantellae]
MNIKGKNINNKTIAILVAVVVAVVAIVGVSISSGKSSANSGKEVDNSQNNNVENNDKKDDNKAQVEEANKGESSEEEETENTVTITTENKDFTKEFVKPDKIVFNKDGDAISLTEEENSDKFNATMDIINKMFNDDMTLKETKVTLDDMSNILTDQNAIQLLYADDQKGNFKINGGEEGAEKTYNEVIIPLSGDSTNLVFLYGAEQANYSEALSEFKYGEEIKKIME